jgi:hypothetical protein
VRLVRCGNAQEKQFLFEKEKKKKKDQTKDQH